MDYKIEVRKTKANAKCRICKKQIQTDTISIFTSGTDGYNKFQLVSHSDCFLRFIIKEIERLKLEDMKKDTLLFKKISELLEENTNVRRKEIKERNRT